ncbi:hypothetical protein B1218_34430, partial [Pseudomonas ogarae]
GTEWNWRRESRGQRGDGGRGDGATATTGEAAGGRKRDGRMECNQEKTPLQDPAQTLLAGDSASMQGGKR